VTTFVMFTLCALTFYVSIRPTALINFFKELLENLPNESFSHI